jgi:Alginate lyase
MSSRMKAAAALLVASTVMIGSCSSGDRAGPEPTPPSAAAGAGALTGWKLSIPVENDDGNATTVDPAAVSPPWLTVDDAGALTFWAPAEGATTKNSSHPRTELNSLDTFKSGRELRTLRASIAVQQEPADGEGIIIAQIHGAKDDDEDIVSVPYVMVQLRSGTLDVEVKQQRKGDDDITYPLLDAVSKDDRIDLELTDTGDGSLRFTATAGSRSATQTAPVPSEFAGATVRFQAGAYPQSKKAAGPDDGGKVVFHRLEQTAE